MLLVFQQEQDRLSNRDRSTREAEQERQWKQLQALRQQQAQLQQQVIHEQRVHGTFTILNFTIQFETLLSFFAFNFYLIKI